MNKPAMANARRCAEEFLRRLDTFEKATAKAPDYYCHPRESGALRRGSMDLTRALADLRRPG